MRREREGGQLGGGLWFRVSHLFLYISSCCRIEMDGDRLDVPCTEADSGEKHFDQRFLVRTISWKVFLALAHHEVAAINYHKPF